MLASVRRRRYFMERMDKVLVAISVVVIIIFLLMILTSPVIVHGKTLDEPEVVEIVAIYDEAGNRGTATISHVRATFSIEVALPDGEVVTVENWRTAKYDLNDVCAVSDKIHCIGEYYPPKYSKFKITRKIFSKAGR